MATFANGKREVPLRPLSSEVYVCSFRSAHPADPGCADTSKPGRLRQLPHSEAHSTYPRSTPNQSVKMRSNLFFIDFNRSGDCLFVFLRYIFHDLFSFRWLEFGHYNQSENRPFFQVPSLKMCAISRTLSDDKRMCKLSYYDLCAKG